MGDRQHSPPLVAVGRVEDVQLSGHSAGAFVFHFTSATTVGVPFTGPCTMSWHLRRELSTALQTVDWTPPQLAKLQFAGEGYAVRHHSLSLVFLSPVALIMTGFAVILPTHGLVFNHVIESTIGATVAVALVLATERAVRRVRTRAPEPVGASAGRQ